jgi:ribonucleotide monophosphatase NagD (HAD superfamily)
VAGNLDVTLPTARGLLPGNGAMVAALRAATDSEPLVAGKPFPALHAQAVARTGARRPLVVGDRLDTDVLGAVQAGADSLLVLTGVVDLPALLAAPVGSRPTYVAATCARSCTLSRRWSWTATAPGAAGPAPNATATSYG